jgi:hypothetical protein
VDVSKTKDKNNFINIILNKIELAKNFHQRVALSITSKVIMNCITLKFYLRRRYQKLFLYIRLQKCSLGNVSNRHQLINDIKTLVPELSIESTKGHHLGFILELNNDTKDALIQFLKIIAVLASPKDFYVKDTQVYKSFWNYQHTSSIPIHLQITQSLFRTLKSADLIYYLSEVQQYDKNLDLHNANINSINDTTK